MEVLNDVRGGSSERFPKGKAKETNTIAGRITEVDKLLSVGGDRGSKPDVITCAS